MKIPQNEEDMVRDSLVVIMLIGNQLDPHQIRQLMIGMELQKPIIVVFTEPVNIFRIKDLIGKYTPIHYIESFKKIDASVIEELIFPIIRKYQSEEEKKNE